MGLERGSFEYLGGAVTKARISDDGTRIVGNVLDETDGTIKAAIHENGNWTPLPPVPGAVPCGDLGVPFYTSVQDISGDGSTVVGLSYGAAGCYGGTTARLQVDRGRRHRSRSRRSTPSTSPGAPTPSTTTAA
jgi:hypothetical protein